MTDYKDTLNLPKTELAMKANLPSKEPKLLKHWEDIDLNQKIKEARSGRDKFILHDGPPYANGEIHTGHAVNKVLKDNIESCCCRSIFLGNNHFQDDFVHI